MRLVRIAAAALGLVVAACGTMGSGDVVTEERPLSGFDRVSVSGAMDAEITVEAGAGFRVTVRADDNLIEQIETDVVGTTLEIGSTGSFVNPTEKVVVVVMPDLAAIEASGASDVTASGVVDALVVDASGASDVDTAALDAETVNVDVSGASDVTVFARSAVTGEASGASNVDILGSPATVQVETSGASDVDF
jgi:hypothetical protein